MHCCTLVFHPFTVNTVDFSNKSNKRAKLKVETQWRNLHASATRNSNRCLKQKGQLIHQIQRWKRARIWINCSKRISCEVHRVYLAFAYSVDLTLGVIGPDSVALRVVEPLAIRITDFSNFLCWRQNYNLQIFIRHVVLFSTEHAMLVRNHSLELPCG